MRQFFRGRAFALSCVVVGAGLVLVALAAVTPADSPAQVKRYNLGQVALAVPGPMGPLPVRLWGVVGIPSGVDPATADRRPLVIVAHGRHGDNCPPGPFDSETWPCFGRELRSELGLTYLVRSLAKRGMYAIAPNLNAAHTAGWGEPDDRRRWPAIINRTLDAILAPHAPRDAATGRRIPGLTSGTVNPRRIGILGHSLSGTNALRLARSRTKIAGRPAAITRGRGPLRSLFLLAPAAGAGTPPDLPTAVALASCDGDTGNMGRRYLRAARRDHTRRTPIYLRVLLGANHNYFNRLLARHRFDDAPTERPACRPGARLRPEAQQRWLARNVGDFFATTLLGASRSAL